MSSELVIPGNKVADCSEWSEGEGVISQGGDIIAVITGFVEFDSESSTVSVSPAGESVRLLEKGDIVIAEVFRLKESMVEANIIEVEGKDFRNLLPDQLRGQMHVTKIVDRYMHQAKDAMRSRDIIRAMVTETKPVTRIEIRGKEGCGVLHAICPDCGEALSAVDDGEDWNVRCENCGHEAFRVLADAYGMGYGEGQGLSELNRGGKRWGKAAEGHFAKGAAARSSLISADYRNDGSKPVMMKFSDEGGRGRAGAGGGGGGGGRGRPQGRKLFVGGIARGIETPQLQALFAKHGEVVDAIVMVDRETGNNRGFGFVTFAEDKDADKAITALNKSELGGRRITVNDADSGSRGDRGKGDRGGGGGKREGDRGGRREAPPGSARMYVGGLPWETTDEGLKTLFGNHGEVIDVHVVTDRGTGKSKGFGFVTMPEADAKTAIVELNGFKFNSRILKVQMAKPAGGSGGGGGHSGRGAEGRGGDGGQRTSREQQARSEEGLTD